MITRAILMFVHPVVLEELKRKYVLARVQTESHFMVLDVPLSLVFILKN